MILLIRILVWITQKHQNQLMHSQFVPYFDWIFIKLIEEFRHVAQVMPHCNFTVPPGLVGGYVNKVIDTNYIPYNYL